MQNRYHSGKATKKQIIVGIIGFAIGLVVFFALVDRALTLSGY